MKIQHHKKKHQQRTPEFLTKPNSFWFIFLFMLLHLNLLTSYGKDFKNSIVWKELPALPPAPGQNIQPGVSAPFVGVSNDLLLIAGGANFPGKPVWDGGKKAYYDDAFALEYNSEGEYKWYTGFKIPYQVAYGVSITVPEGVICIGGSNNKESFSSVFLMKWDPVSKQIETIILPSLPFTMSRMAGALVDRTIYLAGGYADGELTNAFLSLDLSEWESDNFEWEIMDDFPGPPRLQPVAIGQNAAEEKHFYLFSGSSYPADMENPLILTDGLEFNPKTQKWKETAPVVPDEKDTISLHGASGIPIGSHHILFTGGVNRDIFFKAWKRDCKIKEIKKTGDTVKLNNLLKEKYAYFTMKPEDFRFNKEVIAYHTITNTWIKVHDYPYPGPAGAPMVKWNNGFVVVNGEIKPGVRSPKIYYGKLHTNIRFGWLNWAVLGIYLIGMLFVGYYFMHREKSTNDFFKGGGRVPWWAAGISIFATVLSAITYITIPAKTYATDWKYFVMAATIPIIAWPVVRYYLPFFRKLNVTTAYEYLEKRFDYNLRSLASGLFLLFMIARMALVLFLPSLALTAVTGINIYLCIALMGIITIIYCTMGGVEAVIWGDVIQGIVLLGGAILTVVFVISGTEGGLNSLVHITIDEQKMRIFDFSFDFTRATFWVVLLGGLSLNLIPYTSDQSVIQRYMTTKDEKTAAKSIWFNGMLSIPVSIIFYFIGTGLYAYFKTQPHELDLAMENADSIFPHFIMARMPIGIAGLMIAAIFSASMSTVSANINSISTAFTVDFYRHFQPGSSDSNRLWVARITGIVAGGIGVALAMFMANWNLLSLFDYFNTFLGLLAGGLAGLFAMGIFFKRINAKGALWGFVSGTILLLYVKFFTPVSFLLYGFIGLGTSVIFGYLFSLITRNSTKDITALTYKSLKDKPK